MALGYKIDVYHHLEDVLQIDVRHHLIDAPPPDPRLDQIIDLLNSVVTKENQIMSNEETALAAIKAVKDATDQQAAVLTTESTTLQTISDNLDKLIANSGASSAVLAGLQSMADSVSAVGVSIQKQADFSLALASKGVATPVPVPVPDPTPIPPTPAVPVP